MWQSVCFGSIMSSPSELMQHHRKIQSSLCVGWIARFDREQLPIFLNAWVVKADIGRWPYCSDPSCRPWTKAHSNSCSSDGRHATGMDISVARNDPRGQAASSSQTRLATSRPYYRGRHLHRCMCSSKESGIIMASSMKASQHLWKG